LPEQLVGEITAIHATQLS